jgi:hypothetical protein
MKTNPYQEVYDWVNRQPCMSADFVSVPIESLAALLHVEVPPKPHNHELFELQFLRSQEKFYRSRPRDLAAIVSLNKLKALEAKYTTPPSSSPPSPAPPTA